MKARLDALSVASTLDAPGNDQYLGFRLSDNTCTPSEKRFCRIERAAFYLVHPRSPISGRDLEHFLGHAAFLLQLRPELLCLLNACYVYVRTSYPFRQPLWKSVQAELRQL